MAVAALVVPAWRQDRIFHLQQLVDELGECVKLGPQLDRARFARLFGRAQSMLEISDDELATRIRVSRPTIGRWARGETAPHPVGMPGVLKTLAEVAKSKLRGHRSAPAMPIAEYSA